VANVKFPPIDYQNIVYYSAPKQKPSLDSLNQVDPELLKTYAKLGIPIDEQKRLSNVAVTRLRFGLCGHDFKDKLGEMGVIFCSFSEAVQSIPTSSRSTWHGGAAYDNFYAALNAACSRRLVVYVPKGVRCPMELSTYFRINAAETGQFERTLIIATKARR